MAFKYVKRSPEVIDRRAIQQGSDFQGFILDDFRKYQVKKGDNAVRILPPTWDGAEYYGIEIYVHFSIGVDKASILCLNKMKEQKCPICEGRARIERSGDHELADEIKPNKRVLVWMLDRKEPDKGPQVWDMPWTVDRDVAKVSRDRDTGEYYHIDHPYEGYDVYFDKTGEGMQVKYQGMQISRKPSSVPDDVLEFIQEVPLPKTLRWRTYDEVAKIFDAAGVENATTSTRRDDRREPSREERREERGEPPREERREERRDPPQDDPPPRRTRPEMPEEPAPRRTRPEMPEEPAPRAAETESSSSTSGRSRSDELRKRWAK